MMHDLRPVTGWTPDDFIVDFWEQSQGWVTNQYWKRIQGTNIAMSDLQGVAADSLVKFARNDYDIIVGRMETTVTDRRMFWALLRRRLNWDLGTYITENQRRDDSVDDLEEMPTLSWMRTNLGQVKHDPNLLHALVYRVTELEAVDQMILALYYFEELAMEQVAAIVGLSSNTIGSRIRSCAALVLKAAIGLVDRFEPVGVPTRQPWNQGNAGDWTKHNYGVGVDAYLAYVAVHYRADVSYLVDMLRSGNGERIRRDDGRTAKDRAAKAKLTDEQVQDIRRRVDAGEKYAPIMQQYEISDTAVSHIKHRRTYAWVPELPAKRTVRKVNGRWTATTSGIDRHYDTWEEAIAL
jgi:hypothetical protein